MPEGAIYDIVPVNSKTNVTASIQDSNGTTKYTAAQVGAVSGDFVSAIYDAPGTEETAFVFTFGTDSGLSTAVGWDNVTGVGTPNAKKFADSFKPKK